MEKEETKVLFDSYYFSFFDDGTFGHSDGVGFCGVTTREEVEQLYLILKNYFENKRGKNEQKIFSPTENF